jgi:hypothetical protein
MTYQHDEKDLTKLSEYLMGGGGVKLACYCLNNRFPQRII